MKLSDDFIEQVRQYSGQEDTAKMQTARIITEYWEEMGKAIAEERKEPESKAHKWYIESVAASVKMSPSSMYNRDRVGQNVIKRGFDIEYDVITFGQWLALLRNAPVEDGLVPVDELCKRLEWVYSEAEEHGGEFPSVRDIEEQYKKNGVHPEWEQYWKAIVRNANKLLNVDKPEFISHAVVEIIHYEKKYRRD